jgi:hypothetical protein
MPSECSPAAPRGCRSHLPGHLTHLLHARLLGRSPWGWREGRVTSVSGEGWLTVACTAEAGTYRAWHHQDLRARLAPGEQVRVHERHSALSGALGVVSLHIARGVGPVPEPVALDVWASPTGASVIDLRTGAEVPWAPHAPSR